MCVAQMDTRTKTNVLYEESLVSAII